MSETSELKITSEVKTKDPKRVEAGKRHAAISKEAKERKARERIMAEQSQNSSDESGNNRTTLIVLGLILVVGGVSYYGFKNKDSLGSKFSKQQNNPLIILTKK